MKSRTLLKICFLSSIFGIILLLVLSLNLEPKTKKIASINEKILGEWIRVQGQILSIKEYKSNKNSAILTILKINDNTASIEIVSRKKLNLTTGMQVEILGKVSEYKETLQIEATKIKIL